MEYKPEEFAYVKVKIFNIREEVCYVETLNEHMTSFSVHKEQLHKEPEPFKVGEELEFSDDGKAWDRGIFNGYGCDGAADNYKYARKPEKIEDMVNRLDKAITQAISEDRYYKLGEEEWEQIKDELLSLI